MRRRTNYIAACGLLLLLAATFFFLDAYGRHSRAFGKPSSLSEGARQRITLSRPSDAFRFWKSKGYHGRIIVELTGRWQPVMVGNEEVDRARYPLQLKNLAQEREKELDDGNYIFVASAVGIARRVITVLPKDGYEKRREMSLSNKTFVEGKGNFTAYHWGFAREFTTIGSLRPPKEPVLLYVEESFLQGVSLQDVLQRLGSAGLIADSIVYSQPPSARENGAPQ